MVIIKRNKQAFSLRDEIGECPNIRLNIDVVDDSPFFVRPFPISEKDKPLMDRQMDRLVQLGILSPNNTSHTSPVMLIARKVTKDKRPVVDFRLLNTRIRRRNTASPLLKDIFNILGHSRCEVMSCVDIKDAFHSIKLNEKSKEFCGILPYFGSTHYRYEVLPMGLAISPAAWLMYVNMLLDTFGEDKRSFIAIMDDLLIHSTKANHFKLIEKLLDGLCRHGLKLSPKKSQLFRTELTYMGSVFTIVRHRMTIHPIRTRLEAITQYPRPKTVKQCKSFCGVVNYLSLFCRDLQKLLQPIYHLTRKGVPFVWTELQEDSFIRIKKQLCESPVLALPTAVGRFIIYSDTSCTHTGSALWQIQDGWPQLIGYASKTLPSACLNYSVTELEMTGLLMNIHTWRSWTQDADVDVAVDHKAVVQILKSKNPPATDRVKALIRKLSPLPFNLYYVKGKDLLLADFLSRIKSDTTDPDEVIPISFVDLSMDDTRVQELVNAIGTRSRTRLTGEAPPPVHGHDKPMDPHKKPEHQPHIAKPVPIPTPPKPATRTPPPPPPRQIPNRAIKPIRPSPAQVTKRKLVEKSIRTLNRPKPVAFAKVPPPKAPLVPTFYPLSPHTPPAPLQAAKPPVQGLKQVPVQGQVPLKAHVPAAPQPVATPGTLPKPALATPPKQIPQKQVQRRPDRSADEITYYPPSHIPANPKTKMKQLSVDPNTDLGIPYHRFKDLVDLLIRAPNKQDTDPLVPLSEIVDVRKVSRRDLPKQKDLDPIIKLIDTRILRQVHLPTTFRDLHGAYLNSPHFRDVYVYLLQNKTPSNTRKRSHVISQSADYMLLDNLLFKVVRDRITKEHKPLLCIPTSKIDMLLHYFHSSLMGGHMGITKTYMTLGQRFYVPNLPHHIRAYIIGCHICQTVKAAPQVKRPFQKRININIPAMCKISMDIKHMPIDESSGYQYILVLICDVSNFMVVAPLTSTTTLEVCKSINAHFIRVFSPPTHITCDLDPAFVSTMAQAFFRFYGIRLITVSPTNHRSLLAEHGIKSLAEILKCHLSGLGPNWTEYLDFAMLAYNSYSTPNLDSMCPFELVFARKPNVLPLTEAMPEAPVAGNFREYYQNLRQKLEYMRRHLVNFRDKRTELQNKDRTHHGFFIGQIVYVLVPEGSGTQKGSQKVKISCVGPLVIMNSLGPNLFELMTLDKEKLRGSFEETMLRPGWVRTPEGPVNTYAEFLKNIKSVLNPTEGAIGFCEGFPELVSENCEWDSLCKNSKTN